LEAYTLGTNKVVKVLNPWGEEAYSGPWNDHDPNWTDEYKRKVNLVVADDGVFFMPISVFREAFAEFHVAMYNENW